MTVKEIYDNVENFSDEQRDTILRNLMNLFCKVSIGEIMTFQDSWNPEKGMDAFFAEQAKIIKKCIALEISNFGKTVREKLGLEPLTWDIEIN